MAASATTQEDLAAAVDPALWGLYVDLAGQSRSSMRNGGTSISWRWIQPGRVLQELWHVTGQASPVDTYTLWRGDEPGRLHSEASGMVRPAWEGQVYADGSVLFVGVNPLAKSFQASLGADGAFELREIIVREGVGMVPGELLPEDRYVRTGSLSGHAPQTHAKRKADPANERYWSYCWYTVMEDDGTVSHYFLSNLINQRIWMDPGTRASQQQRAEYQAYAGPNTQEKVEERFDQAMMASGRLPHHLLGGARCESFSNHGEARRSHEEMKTERSLAPVEVRWNRVTDERLAQ